MLKRLIGHEFLRNLYNLRFLVGLSLCILITLACVIILTEDYRQELHDYRLRVVMQERFLDEYAHVNRLGPMIQVQKPPSPFHPLVTGLQEDVWLGSFDDNPMPVLFPPIDLVFIVTVLMSLMALLFSYDAITGEREHGTLKLVISNGVSRSRIIVSKWIGGTASLLVPFALSVLAGSLIITLHPAVQWDTPAWTTFILLLLASATFISVFYLMGLMVSAFSRYSSRSILSSLFLWVLFILIIPNLSPFLSAQFYSIPSVHRIVQERHRLLDTERDELGRQLQSRLDERYEQEYGPVFLEMKNMDREAISRRAGSDSEFQLLVRRYRQEAEAIWDEANRIQREKAEKLTRDLEIRAGIQTGIAKNLACLSPYSNFIYVATDLTETGLRNLGHFENMARQYGGLLHPYIERKYREAQEKDPAFGVNSYLDIRDRPRFRFSMEPLEDRLTGVLPYWGILIGFAILFFCLALARMSHYDVR
jgi:ABC-type transport system involved in multi-copper enzyme maturation permease subunit